MAEKLRILVPVFMCVAGLLMAQQQPSGTTTSSGSTPANGTQPRKSLTIEQLYLSQNIETQILRSQALSNSRDMQMLALQSIRAMVQNGTAKNNPAIGVVLDTLATQGLTRQVRDNNVVQYNYPEVRREACNLLGDIGGEQAKRTLLTVLITEKEPMVLAEAVFALGKIGLNQNNDVAQHIAYVMNQNNANKAPDNNLAFACLLAIQNLAKKSGAITDPEVINAMLNIASGNYIRDVRLKAIDVIYQLEHQPPSSTHG